MFRAESLELLARRRHQPRKQVRELPLPCSLNEQQPDDDPNDNPDPDDCALPALPPPPDWSHILGGRQQEAASGPLAHMALLAVGCRLSISPTTDALCEAARCHSVGAVRSLLAHVYGERGLANAYELAGREQPDKPANRVDGVTAGEAMPVNCDALEPGLAHAIMQAPSRVQRWMLAPPRDPPRWRTSAPPEGMDDGSWTG